MDRRRLAILASSSVGLNRVVGFAQSLPSVLPARARHLLENNAAGDLLLPKNFHKWTYVGSALAPNALNSGLANFPELPNVYLELGAYEIHQTTNIFPEGTDLSKELQLTVPAEDSDGSRREPSGRGYLPDSFKVASAEKDEIWTRFYPLLDK
jgi:hypothetical protein